jgi:hypothetical protein
MAKRVAGTGAKAVVPGIEWKTAPLLAKPSEVPSGGA